MRVALVSSYLPQPCGIATYTHYLAEAACASDPSLSLTVLATQPAVSIPCSPFRVEEAFAAEENYATALLSHIEAVQPDVVHIQHEYGIFGVDERFHHVLAGLQARAIPTAVTLHSVHTRLSFNGGCVRPEVRRFLKRVDIEAYQHRIGERAGAVIVHQDGPIRGVLVRQGLDARRVSAIPHGTRLLPEADAGAARAALGLTPEMPLIVAFGYLEPAKNLLTLIRAFQRVRQRIPNVRLWLGGYVRNPVPATQRYRERCLQLIEALGLHDAVIFCEHAVPEDGVPALLSAADVVCLAYREDTRSASGGLHLALGLGRPVVASRIPKFDELVDVCDEVLVNPGSVGELSRVLRRMLSDGAFRQSIQARIKTYAGQTAWPIVAREHLALYERLAATGAANGERRLTVLAS